MSFKLPDSLYSADQLQVCSDELRRYAEALQQGQYQKEAGSKTAKIVLPELSASSYDLLEALPKSKRLDPALVEQICDVLDGWMKTAPVMNITLAAPATHQLKTELVSWFRTNIGPQTILSFHVNPDIAGGIVVRSTNHVYDMSFRRELLKRPEKLIEVIDHV